MARSEYYQISDNDADSENEFSEPEKFSKSSKLVSEYQNNSSSESDEVPEECFELTSTDENESGCESDSESDTKIQNIKKCCGKIRRRTSNRRYNFVDLKKACEEDSFVFIYRILKNNPIITKTPDYKDLLYNLIKKQRFQAANILFSFNPELTCLVLNNSGLSYDQKTAFFCMFTSFAKERMIAIIENSSLFKENKFLKVKDNRIDEHLSNIAANVMQNLETLFLSIDKLLEACKRTLEKISETKINFADIELVYFIAKIERILHQFTSLGTNKDKELLFKDIDQLLTQGVDPYILESTQVCDLAELIKIKRDVLQSLKDFCSTIYELSHAINRSKETLSLTM